MVEHDEVEPQRWSCYDEYLKSRKIAKVREHLPELDDVVVSQIRTGKIEKAADVRDKLAPVCSAQRGKTVRTFIAGKRSLDECYEDAIAGGANNAFYNRLRRFREHIKTPEAKREIMQLPVDLRSKFRYELDKIYHTVKEFLDLLSKGS
jgi:hypothetical protein